MGALTGIERTLLSLSRKNTDHLAFCEHFWSGVKKNWVAQGMPDTGHSMAEQFHFDIDEMFAINYVANLDTPTRIVAETENTVTTLDGNGATLRRFTDRDGVPEHIAFTVQNRESYYEHIYEHICAPSHRRVEVEGYRRVKEECQTADRFFCLTSGHVFELMHSVCGHENLLMGMVEDPGWVGAMAMDYARLIVGQFELLFEQEGRPDGVWFWDDLGFKERPFISPAMYKELLMPAHTYVFEYCKRQGLPVIFHSCGFVEPLLPLFIEAGIDCLQAMEVKAGMNPVRIKKNFGDKIALMGGIDVREIMANNIQSLEKHLSNLLPQLTPGYILHSDHSIPKDVDYTTFQFFREQAYKY